MSMIKTTRRYIFLLFLIFRNIMAVYTTDSFLSTYLYKINGLLALSFTTKKKYWMYREGPRCVVYIVFPRNFHALFVSSKWNLNTHILSYIRLCFVFNCWLDKCPYKFNTHWLGTSGSRLIRTRMSHISDEKLWHCTKFYCT